MNDFKKIVNIGEFKQYNGKYYGNVYCKIIFKDGRLSISGVESPQSNGNCRGGVGQIYDSLNNIDKFNKGWNIGKLNGFIAIWKIWHLNDMRTGTPTQMRYLRMNNISRNANDYETACTILKTAGLYNINGKKYGHSWYFEAVPEDVLQWLKDLQDSEDTPNWV